MTKRAKAGDIFSVPLPRGTEIFCQLLLDVRTQCIRPRLLPADSRLRFYADTFLQRVLRGPTPASGSLLPPVFIWEHGWNQVGHGAVVPEQVDFPQGLLANGVRQGFVWGELWLPIALTAQEMMAINAFPPIKGSVAEIALHALGRTAEIDPQFKVPEIFAASQLDLRESPHKGRIYSLLGARIGSTYFETALRYGYDVRRFYGREHCDRELVLCPYCQAPFDPTNHTCPTCKQDTRDDAPTSVTAQQLAEWERVSCRACQTPILDTARVCPGCRALQGDCAHQLLCVLRGLFE
jgi:hypothetical protein